MMLLGIISVSFAFELFVIYLTCCFSIDSHGTILMSCNNFTLWCFMITCCNNDTILMSVVYLMHISDYSSHKSGDVWTMRTMSCMRAAQNNLCATTFVASNYFMTYHDRKDPITPIQSGFSWTMESLNTGRRPKMFRMDSHLFYQLHGLLVSTYGLRSSMHINSMESLAMFLVICGHGMSISAIQRIFNHSLETICRKFDEVLYCVVAMC
jgi:uncharacterized membrane protein YidH (DUF202 family)